MVKELANTRTQGSRWRMAACAPFVAGAVLFGTTSGALAAQVRPAAVAHPSVATGVAKVPHPNLKGLHLNMVWNGTPEASQITEVHSANILKSWGASITEQFATGTPVAYADMLHGGSFLADSMVDVLNGFNSGVPLTSVALAQPRQDYVFVARPGITSLSQLAGKTVGVLNMQGINGAQLLTVLKLAKLSINQITVNDTGGQSERLAALLSGRIDATMISHQALLELGPTYKVLYDYTKQDTALYDDLWSARPSFIKQHPQAVVALNEADLLSCVYFNNPKNDSAMFAEIRAIDPALTRNSTIPYFDSFRKTNPCPDGTILNAKSLQSQEGTYKAIGAITSTPPLSSWIATNFGVVALKKLGKYAR